MIPRYAYLANLEIVSGVRDVAGCVVECGVWRGGMSGGMAEVLGSDRQYFLFDSFEGLPPAGAVDGEDARAWQADTSAPGYFDNCRAEMNFAEEAMRRSSATRHQLIKGWFDETLPHFQPPQPIAVLRLDADWYASTMSCLQHLFRFLSPNGIVIIDDYYTWDGCSKATHDFLSSSQSDVRIHEINNVCFLRRHKP